MRILLSYRYEDSGDFTERMTDHLLRRYGPASVIRNVVGKDAQDYLARVDGWLRQCDVVLVVIGPHWAALRDAQSQRLIDNPLDPIHIQIQQALAQQKLIVPLLVGGATMPVGTTLPTDLAALSLHQAHTIRSDPDFDADMVSVYTQINTQLEWQPVSLLVVFSALAGVVGIAGILFAANVFGGIPLEVLSAILSLAGFIVALGTASNISLRLKQWWWLGGIIGAALASVVINALPNAIVQYLVWLAALAVLMVFGFVGPRRERVFNVT